MLWLKLQTLLIEKTESVCICPMCERETTVECIACDSCDQWFHFQCVNLSPTTIDNTYKEIGFHCLQCNDNLLYEAQLESNLSLQETIPKHIVHETSPKHIVDETSIHNENWNNELYIVQDQTQKPEDTLSNIELSIPTTKVSAQSSTVPVITEIQSNNSNNNATNQQLGTTGNNINNNPVKKTMKRGSTKIEDKNVLNSQRTRILNLENENKQLKTLIDTMKTCVPNIQTNEDNKSRNQSQTDPNRNIGNSTNSQQNYHSNSHQQKCCHDDIMELRIRTLENHICMSTALNLHISMQSRMMNPFVNHMPFIQPPSYYAHGFHPNMAHINPMFVNTMQGPVPPNETPFYGPHIQNYSNPHQTFESFQQYGGLHVPSQTIHPPRYNVQTHRNFSQQPTFGQHQPQNNHNQQPTQLQHQPQNTTRNQYPTRAQEQRATNLQHQSAVAEKQGSANTNETENLTTPVRQCMAENVNQTTTTLNSEHASNNGQNVKDQNKIGEQESLKLSKGTKHLLHIPTKFRRPSQNSSVDLSTYSNEDEIQIENITDSILLPTTFHFRLNSLEHQPPDNRTLNSEMAESGKRRSI